MSYLILSGLPASGKSTLARAIAPVLALPVLDKDDLLEGLFAARGIGDAAWRAALLLVSWWRHPLGVSQSGTPTAWLASLPGPTLEVHCVCAPTVAAQRFADRQRHAGHLDRARSRADLLPEFIQHAAAGALGVGPLVSVRTDMVVDVAAVLAAVRSNDGRC